ncbi:MAG: class I SAM-dependent methyltransferase [Pseudomonadota bacterium]|nr:class I SAM-dependent methyltransferase [Pseudomonadota bacterium]
MTATSDHDQLYSKHAPRWHQRLGKLGYTRAYDHLMAQLPPLPDQVRVLDIGTGSGAFAASFAKQAPANCQLTLADPNPEMRSEAAAQSQDWPQTVQITDAKLGDRLGQYDVLLCAHVLEHLEIAPALRWLHQSLAPGGTLVLALSRPHWCTALLRWRWGHRAYRPDQARDHLAAAGFGDIQLIPFPSGPPYRTSHGYIARR